ncbi:MAG: dapE [Alphaproteobacteria bacterium]|jgi:succinyl-diaminopimelate desuccinylase|nr:dapE [Alphaproteobacteria bacterium]
MVDPVLLTQQLLRCPSVTPDEAGTLAIVAEFLAARGFSLERLDSGNVTNLYARRGTSSPHLCFGGHTDVVPAGDRTRWLVNPFAGEICDGKLYGRGAVDMKGAIGAYLAAVDSYLQQNLLTKGSLSILLTSDEEGPAIDGLRYVVDQFKARGEHIDACLVGEPTNMARVGDTVKVGRRGSLNATLTVQGKSGHVAYPHLAKNPISPLLAYLQTLLSCPLDEGMPNFDPSHLEVTSVDVGNPTSNVIPLQATAKFNIRFNPAHTLQSLTCYLHSQARQAGLSSEGFAYTLDIQASGDAFFCEDKGLQHLVSDAILATTNLTPIFSTSGGTSDARFLKDICPVIEFGLINATAHQVDEHIALEEIHRLTAVYQGIIERFFR